MPPSMMPPSSPQEGSYFGANFAAATGESVDATTRWTHHDGSVDEE